MNLWARDMRSERSASQRELDLLRSRVDLMDAQGTRGTAAAVGIMATQLQDLAKDLAAQREATRLWQDRHEAAHQGDAKARAAEVRARAVARRWLIGVCISALVLLVAILSMLLQLAGRMH